MTEMDFANYELLKDLDVYGLAGGLLPEIAEAADFELAPHQSKTISAS